MPRDPDAMSMPSSDPSRYDGSKAEPPYGDAPLCPFCGEPDMDLVGLKMHLTRGWCEAFNATHNE